MNSAILKVKESRWTSRLLSPIILVLLAVIFSVATSGRFSDPTNIKTIVEQSLIVGVVATGASFIYATGNVNISMGSSTALMATIAAMTYLQTESIVLMFVVAVVGSVVLLGFCAALSTILHVRVLFVTVVMMILLSSIQQSLLGSTTLSVPYALTSGLKSINISYILFAVFFIFCGVLFHFTSFGRKLRSIGANSTGAELTGFSENKYLLLAFLVAGIGVGLGAILTIVRAGAISKDTCASLNMDCMLAIVLGGMAVFGGSRSNTYAAIVGALIVTVLNNGLLMIGISNTILQAVRGVIFIILVCASQARPNGLPDREG